MQVWTEWKNKLIEKKRVVTFSNLIPKNTKQRSCKLLGSSKIAVKPGFVWLAS